jgi:TRAP-type mannitol/chloroaromatic compound transport system permease large subunit
MTNPEVALLMLGLFIVLVLLGFPIAFTLLAMGVGFGYYAYHQGHRSRPLPTSSTTTFSTC